MPVSTTARTIPLDLMQRDSYVLKTVCLTSCTHCRVDNDLVGEESPSTNKVFHAFRHSHHKRPWCLIKRSVNALQIAIIISKARGSSVDSFDKTAAFLRYTLSKR